MADISDFVVVAFDYDRLRVWHVLFILKKNILILSAYSTNVINKYGLNYCII